MRRRIPAALVFLALLGLFVLVSRLPTDESLARVRRKGVLVACHPADLPPFIYRAARSPGGVGGLEPEVLRRVAERVGVPLQWNLQPNWYATRNPGAWGIRQESCDLLVGGIVGSALTREFLDVSNPYRTTRWVWVTRTAGQADEGVTAAFWAPFFRLDRFDAVRYLQDGGYQPRFFDTLDQAVTALLDGDVAGLLTERWTAQWVIGLYPELRQEEVAELEGFAFTFGFWKGDTTLRRAVNAALRRVAAEVE